jgi:hypothetical protein
MQLATVRRLVPAALIAVALSGCGTSLLRDIDGTPYFPTERPDRPGIRMAALGGGTLSLEDNCLWLRSRQERHLIIWPAGNRLEWRGGALVVVADDGRALAQVGDDLTVGGGEWRAAEAGFAIDAQVEAMIGMPIPPACREGLYWIGGVVDE